MENGWTDFFADPAQYTITEFNNRSFHGAVLFLIDCLADLPAEGYTGFNTYLIRNILNT